MSSPDDPGLRRRRRRSRRSAEAGADLDRAGTSPAGEPELDEAGARAIAGRRGRSGGTGRAAKADRAARADQAAKADQAGRPVQSGKPARNGQPARAGRLGKPTGQRRQPTESARTIRETERGWRDLAGSGSSQLGVSGALRARDVSRPGPAELAEAEGSVQLVRRQWQPPATD